MATQLDLKQTVSRQKDSDTDTPLPHPDSWVYRGATFVSEELGWKAGKCVREKDSKLVFSSCVSLEQDQEASN